MYYSEGGDQLVSKNSWVIPVIAVFAVIGGLALASRQPKQSATPQAVIQCAYHCAQCADGSVVDCLECGYCVGRLR